MSDIPERPVDYQPEEGEVRAAPRYSVSPGGYETLTRDVSETPYQSLSLAAVAALVLAVGYSAVVALGGIAAFWFNVPWLLLLGTVLVPLLSVPVALKFNVRGPLALLRVAALALAAFYAVPVGIIGLIAFPTHAPWLLPLWTLLFPLVAVGVALAARARIQFSEGTLSGQLLTTWAVGLSLFFALCYTAFYAATYLAVSQQAEQYAGDWIAALQQDDVDRAFVKTIPSQYRTSETLSRQEVEEVNNRQRAEEGLGALESFAQKPCVRLLNRASQAQVELVGVDDWGYEGGGYKVDLSYRVTTPYYSFPLKLTLFGATLKGDTKGRRWCVQRESPSLGRLDPHVTDQGQQLLKLAYEGDRSGAAFADAWTKKLWNNEVAAYQDTLPPDERGQAVALDTAVPAAVGLGMRAYRPLPAFFHGGLVQSDEKTFWANAKIRQQLVDGVERMFAPGSAKPESLRFRDERKTWPLWSEANGRLLFRYDLDMTLPIQIQVETLAGTSYEPSKGVLEGRLVLSCPVEALTTGKPVWRVEALELVRGRRFEEVKRGPGGPPR